MTYLLVMDKGERFRLKLITYATQALPNQTISGKTLLRSQKSKLVKEDYSSLFSYHIFVCTGDGLLERLHWKAIMVIRLRSFGFSCHE